MFRLILIWSHHHCQHKSNRYFLLKVGYETYMLILWTCLKTPSLIPLPPHRIRSNRLCIVWNNFKIWLPPVLFTSLSYLFLYHLPFYNTLCFSHTKLLTLHPTHHFFPVFMHNTCWHNSLDFPSPCGKFQLILQIFHETFLTWS